MFTKKRIALIIVIAALLIAVPVMAIMRNPRVDSRAEQMQALTLWQIDGFEGGKGSRAQYLADKAEKLFKNRNKYVNVITLTAEAAADNIENGSLPDMISFPPTFGEHLSCVNRADFVYKNWCYGSYCLLKLQENADFADVNASNVIVNEGKDNLACVAVTLCGLSGAKRDVPTNAYLQLLNGKYKYLLGTQRDVFRLKTREVAFSVKKIERFNDLFQNISIITKEASRYETCRQFVEYITENNSDVNKLGLFSQNAESYADELSVLQKNNDEYVLKAPCGAEYLTELKNAAANNDVNKIKNLLK